MELTELSKEELIYVIKLHGFMIEECLEFDILSYRAERCLSMSIYFGEKANDFLGDYIKIMNPYNGKPLSDISIETIKSANEAMKQREIYLKKERSKKAEYKRIQKRMDKILNHWRQD